jgi:hypothetical protein
MFVIVAGLVVALVFGFVGQYVSRQKHRPATEGWWLGFGLGPIGALIAVLLPTKEAPKRKPARRMARSGWQPPRDDGMDQEVTNWLRDP